MLTLAAPAVYTPSTESVKQARTAEKGHKVVVDPTFRLQLCAAANRPLVSGWASERNFSEPSLLCRTEVYRKDQYGLSSDFPDVVGKS